MSEINHSQIVQKILEGRTSNGTLKSRESATVEFKQSFNKNSTAKYAKTLSAFANNHGGYIIFGVKDSPRELIGFTNSNFDNLSQEQFTEAINALFAPSIDWEMGTLIIDNKKVGWIYAEEAEQKPVVALKGNDGEKFVAGDIFYRYRARTEKIKYAEITRIIQEKVTRERENLLKLMEVIRKSETANLGIVNYNNGRISTPYGVDVAFDRRLVKKVLKKAKFIKEGSFHETEGIPVIRVTGNIDLAEEVPVPEGNPDETHPYIQKQLAEKLSISTQDLYALIWYFKMKESKKYHLEITTSSTSKTHKFSAFALQFLQEKIKEFDDQPEEFDRIRQAYKNRNKVGGNS